MGWFETLREMKRRHAIGVWIPRWGGELKCVLIPWGPLFFYPHSQSKHVDSDPRKPRKVPDVSSAVFYSE